MKRILCILALVLSALSAAAQPGLKEITITATRTSNYYGEVKLTAILSCDNSGQVGQIQTRIFNRFIEPGRTVNRLVAEASTMSALLMAPPSSRPSGSTTSPTRTLPSSPGRS